MDQPAPVHNPEQDAYLLNRARHLLCYQLICIAAVVWPAPRLSLHIASYTYDIGIVVFLILSFVCLYQTFNNTECPQCGRNFFLRAGPIGNNFQFSIYTHKCANCKYKLQK